MHNGARAIVAALALAVIIFASTKPVTAQTQSITIKTSHSEGTVCTLTSPSLGRKSVVTPATFTVEAAWSSIEVHCSKECFEGVASIRPALFGGYPPETMVVLKPIKNCAVKKK